MQAEQFANELTRYLDICAPECRILRQVSTGVYSACGWMLSVGPGGTCQRALGGGKGGWPKAADSGDWVGVSQMDRSREFWSWRGWQQ